MKTTNLSFFRLLLAALVFAASTSASLAQEEADDVVRVKTELVQTDVSVVDRQGRFVEGLQAEQFELRVDGKPKPISFFERVKTGSVEEERQLGAARNKGPQVKAEPTSSQTHGRTLFFFVDDVHLAPENLARARGALLRFIENGINEGDRVSVVSSSGQVGFLQQLTDNKTVLREAVARLAYKRNPEVNAGPASISEFDANQVEAGNRDLFRYLVQAMARLGNTNPVGTVINRSRQTNATARFDMTTTLGMLDALLRSSAEIPGRKIVFLISDGFVVDARRNGLLDSLRRVTHVAAQVGAVIYTMDTRGTFADPYTDASTNPYPDFTGSVSRSIFAEAAVTQEPLRILADDTGGQAILNSNSFEDGFKRALLDSSDYYLLAWRPERAEYSEKARITVSITGRPDLKVRLRRGFITLPASLINKKERAGKAPEGSPEGELLSALASVNPVRALPLALSVGYTRTPEKGEALTVSMQIEAAALRDDASAATEKVEVDVLGVALNDRGSISSFKQKLSIPTASARLKADEGVVWNQQLPLAPGLYQVRVAVRERMTGRTGSAMQWIEVPAVTPGGFSMSSIFIGEKRSADSASLPQVPISVTRRLARTSRLRYQTYFYNAASDATVQVRITRDGQTVLTLPQNKLAVNKAFAGELALEQFAQGRYLLQISAADPQSGKSIAQQIDFIVE